MDKINALFYGQKPKTVDLVVAIYLAFLFGVYSVFNGYFTNSNYNVWQYILLVVLAIDVCGGLFLNLTKSTKDYYSKNNNLQLAFLLIHFIQPLLLVLVLKIDWSYFVFIYVYTLLSTYFVILLRRTAYDMQIAVLLFTIGMIVTIQFFNLPHAIIWFAPLYMAKLIIGFGTKYSQE